MHKRIQRLTTLALACALMLSLLPMAVPKAGAASTSTLANVTETYVDASDGSEVSKSETYSVTHKERTPQKIADYTYQDYSESVERVSAPMIKCKKTPKKKCRFVAERRKKR